MWLLIHAEMKVNPYYNRGPKWLEPSFYLHPNCNIVITTKLCTCHESCAVVACKKCIHMIASNRIMATRIFHSTCKYWGISEWHFMCNINPIKRTFYWKLHLFLASLNFESRYKTSPTSMTVQNYAANTSLKRSMGWKINSLIWIANKNL